MYLKLGGINLVLSGAIGNVPELTLKLLDVGGLDVQQLCIFLQTSLILRPLAPQLGLEGVHLPSSNNTIYGYVLYTSTTLPVVQLHSSASSLLRII